METKNYTRQDYLNRVCNHREYYSQFVTEYIKREVARLIGKDAILASNDESFNDIPLAKWDNIDYLTRTSSISQALRDKGDYLTMSGNVCILKEAARQIKEENSK